MAKNVSKEVSAESKKFFLHKSYSLMRKNLSTLDRLEVEDRIKLMNISKFQQVFALLSHNILLAAADNDKEASELVSV